MSVFFSTSEPQRRVYQQNGRLHVPGLLTRGEAGALAAGGLR
jgi:hypothetical protein